MSKKLLVRFLVLILITGLGHSVYWFFKAGQLEKHINNFVASNSSYVSIGSFDISGFPLMQTITIRDLKFSIPNSALGDNKVVLREVKATSKAYKSDFNLELVGEAVVFDKENKSSNVDFTQKPEARLMVDGGKVSEFMYKDQGYRVFDAEQNLIYSAQSCDVKFRSMVDAGGKITSKVTVDIKQAEGFGVVDVYRNAFEDKVIDGIKTGNLKLGSTVTESFVEGQFPVNLEEKGSVEGELAEKVAGEVAEGEVAATSEGDTLQAGVEAGKKVVEKVKGAGAKVANAAKATKGETSGAVAVSGVTSPGAKTGAAADKSGALEAKVAESKAGEVGAAVVGAATPKAAGTGADKAGAAVAKTGTVAPQAQGQAKQAQGAVGDNGAVAKASGKVTETVAKNVADKALNGVVQKVAAEDEAAKKASTETSSIGSKAGAGADNSGAVANKARDGVVGSAGAITGSAGTVSSLAQGAADSNANTDNAQNASGGEENNVEKIAVLKDVEKLDSLIEEKIKDVVKNDILIDVEYYLVPTNAQQDVTVPLDPTQIKVTESEYNKSFKVNKIEIKNSLFKVEINGQINQFQDDDKPSGFATIKIENSVNLVNALKEGFEKIAQENNSKLDSFDASYNSDISQDAYKDFLMKISFNLGNVISEISMKNQLTSNDISVLELRREKNLDFVVNETPMREILGKF